MQVYRNIFDYIVSPEALFVAWERFRRGKGRWPDVLAFEERLEQNIFTLHRELVSGTYRHGAYRGFWVRDPKLRHIHKAVVRDRIVHHALARILAVIFEPTFVPTSYSCRIGKGTHKAVEKLAHILWRESRNGAHQVWVLKCDVRRFFDSIDHKELIAIIGRRVKDERGMWLVREVVASYDVTGRIERE